MEGYNQPKAWAWTSRISYLLFAFRTLTQLMRCLHTVIFAMRHLVANCLCKRVVWTWLFSFALSIITYGSWQNRNRSWNKWCDVSIITLFTAFLKSIICLCCASTTRVYYVTSIGKVIRFHQSTGRSKYLLLYGGKVIPLLLFILLPSNESPILELSILRIKNGLKFSYFSSCRNFKKVHSDSYKYIWIQTH